MRNTGLIKKNGTPRVAISAIVSQLTEQGVSLITPHTAVCRVAKHDACRDRGMPFFFAKKNVSRMTGLLNPKIVVFFLLFFLWGGGGFAIICVKIPRPWDCSSG